MIASKKVIFQSNRPRLKNIIFQTVVNPKAVLCAEVAKSRQDMKMPCPLLKKGLSLQYRSCWSDSERFRPTSLSSRKALNSFLESALLSGGRASIPVCGTTRRILALRQGRGGNLHERRQIHHAGLGLSHTPLHAVVLGLDQNR